MKANKIIRNKSILRMMPLIWVLTGLFLLNGCSYKTKNILFKTEQKLEMKGLPVFHVNGDNRGSTVPPEHTIQADDLISVRFLNSSDLDKVTLVGNATEGQELSFLVDRNGEVVLPIIGRTKLVGYTRKQASEKLESLYSAQIQNPVIDVTILSRTISVLGEVTRPGLYEMKRERVTLVEMLAESGGITKFGKKKNVKVIRKKANGERELIIFDLTQENALSPNELILQDKDIVYVEPRGIKLVSDALSPYTPILSIVATIGTLSLVVVNVIRYTN